MSFLELLLVLWEIAFALWDFCIDGMYSFPPETKVNNSGGKPKVQASRTILVCSPNVQRIHQVGNWLAVSGTVIFFHTDSLYVLGS